MVWRATGRERRREEEFVDAAIRRRGRAPVQEILVRPVRKRREKGRDGGVGLSVVRDGCSATSSSSFGPDLQPGTAQHQTSSCKPPTTGPSLPSTPLSLSLVVGWFEVRPGEEEGERGGGGTVRPVTQLSIRSFGLTSGLDLLTDLLRSGQRP